MGFTTNQLNAENLFGITIPSYVATLAHERNTDTVRPTRSTFTQESNR
jgi:hypothetical protein